ncbi:hypothetical protein ABZ341_09125, partial [Streptomyces sp. NPDC006173]|uniref:hypothetical protein n=1 Tax=Streptomyces sp. NPDC006173 TaxID=3155349 RepID=UPI0033D63DA0
MWVAKRQKEISVNDASEARLPALGTHLTYAPNPSRAETREQLSKATYDLLVIGGGILGISTA